MNRYYLSVLLFVFLSLTEIQLIHNLRQYNCPNRISREGPFGGSGGSAFNDADTTNNRNVNIDTINVRSGAYIDQIKVTYKDQSGNLICGPSHGGTGGSPDSWTLPSGERIERVIVYSGAYVDSLQFVTDAGTYSPKWGGNGGERHEVTLIGNIVSIFGRSGAYIDQIGFTVC